MGFFPFQRNPLYIGGPVGGTISDHQAFIVEPDAEWDPIELIRGCGLVAWDFDHLLASQKDWTRFHSGTAPSPIIRIEDGFEVYCRERRAGGSKRILKILGLSRKLERECGPVHYEAHAKDESTLESVFRWKSLQCRRSGVQDFMSEGWVREALRNMLGTSTSGFTGMLSVLRNEDDVIAAHFGIRTGTAAHYWFPTYNREYARYSPGNILLLRILESLSELGVQYLDLGKGAAPYKKSFANDQIQVAKGTVSVSRALPAVRKARALAVDFIRKGPIGSVYRGMRNNR